MQLVAGGKQRWQGPIFRACAVIACAEHYRREKLQIARRERGLTRQPNLDDLTGANMNTLQAGRQSGRIVCYDQVSRPQKLSQVGARRMSDMTELVDV
jgi:hypothetical protein